MITKLLPLITFDYKINSFDFLSLKICSNTMQCNAMAEEPSIRWNTLFSEELQQSEIGKKAALIVQWDTCSIQPTQIWPPRQPSATRYCHNCIRVQYWTAQYPEGWTDCIWAQYFCNLTRLDLITMAKAMESMIEFAKTFVAHNFTLSRSSPSGHWYYFSWF